MSPSWTSLKGCIAAGVLLLSFHQPAYSQKKPERANLLAGFEKQLSLGRVSEVERPLLAYALANPGDVKALELLGRVRVLQGHLDEARALYQRLMRLAPESASVKTGAARVAYAQGRADDARTILSSIPQTSSMSDDERIELAAVFYSVGEFSKAATTIDALPAAVKNRRALPLAAAVYLATGQSREFRLLIPEMKADAAARPASAVQNADVLQAAGLAKEAAEVLGIALRKAGSSPTLLLALARLEIASGDFAKARGYLKAASSSGPRSAELISAQAMLENGLGNTGAAFDLLTKARQIDPESSRVLGDFAVLAMRAGRPKAAADAARTLISRNPQNAEYQYLLGAASLQGGDLATAQTTLESFTQRRPGDSRGCLALGLVFAAANDHIEEARRQLGHCIDIDPANFEARYQLGLSHKAQGENDKATQILEETLARAPDYGPALRDLGTLYLQGGSDAKARELLERAAAKMPQDAETHFQLSRLYNQIGEPALAKQHLEMFQKLKNPGGRNR